MIATITPPLLITAPTQEPVTLAEAKAHCRVDHGDDDGLIQTLLETARAAVETDARIQCVTATYKVYLDGWPYVNGDVITLPKPPLQSITHIKYYDTAGTLTTLSASLYQTDITSVPGRVRPAYGQTWPTVRTSTLNAIEIQYVCGYSPTAVKALPRQVKQCILLMVGNWYENRETTISGTIIAEVPNALQYLLDQVRVQEYF